MSDPVKDLCGWEPADDRCDKLARALLVAWEALRWHAESEPPINSAADWSGHMHRSEATETVTRVLAIVEGRDE